MKKHLFVPNGFLGKDKQQDHHFVGSRSLVILFISLLIKVQFMIEGRKMSNEDREGRLNIEMNRNEGCVRVPSAMKIEGDTFG